MIIVDRFFQVDKVGNFATLVGVADLHLLCASTDDCPPPGVPKKDLADDEDEKATPGGFQPLDRDAFNYFRACLDEIRANPKYYGRPLTVTVGDNTELERSSVRKVMRTLRKNDSRAQDTVHKTNINRYVIPKIHTLLKNTDFIGGVAGNHMIEFADSTLYRNSEEYIVRRLKGVYGGEAMMVINFHVKYGKTNTRLIRAVIQHGTRGGSKNAIMKELQAMYALFGEVHLLIKAHAHDPMTAFYARYKIPDSQDAKKMMKQETLVMCLGATRDGIKIGYDDYNERMLFSPSAARFPVAIFRAVRLAENGGRLDIKIRPLTM